MFVRRLYYDLETGETLYSYMMSGAIQVLPADEIAAGLGLANYAYMEWLEPDQEIEDSFARSYGRVSVDITQEPHELIFDTSEPPRAIQRVRGYAGGVRRAGRNARGGDKQ